MPRHGGGCYEGGWEELAMTADELIARARSALGKSVQYTLGLYTGLDFNSEDPPAGGLDCSTFVRWAARLKLDGEAWNTSAIAIDAIGAQPTYFEALSGGAQRGCLIVYPHYNWSFGAVNAKAYRTFAPHSQGENFGHIGIVTQTASKGGKEVAAMVIHCSSLTEGYRQVMKPESMDGAIIESSPLWFESFSPIYVRIKPEAYAGE
jgi:hypothetical protein